MRNSALIRKSLLLIAVINCLVGVKIFYDSLGQSVLYKKDFIQGYLMAKAILHGDNPYAPLPDLAEKWIAPNLDIALTHPTPHPIPVGVLCIPLASLGYKPAFLLWALVEMQLLLLSLALMNRAIGVTMKPAVYLAVTAFLVGWAPVTDELINGQLNLILLPLLLAAWIALRNQKFAIGGAFLGATIGLKLTGWPIVLFLLYRRKWKAVITSGITVSILHLIQICALGANVVLEYYGRVGPLIASIYRGHEANYSSWTWGKRVFGRFGRYFIADPLIYSAPIESLLTYTIPIAILLIGLSLAARATQFDTSFGVLIIVGVLISPVAWPHYLILALIPAVILYQRFKGAKLSFKFYFSLFVLFYLTTLTMDTYIKLASRLSPERYSEGLPLLPWWASILTLADAAPLFGMLYLLLKTDSVGQLQYSLQGALDMREKKSLKPSLGDLAGARDGGAGKIV
jgi:hypothetical protein